MITPKAIEEYKTHRLQHVKPATVNRELALLKHMFTKAIEWAYTKENPAKGVKLLREPPGRVRYLMPEELSRLLDACALHLQPIVLMGVHTGMRVQEILTLTWPQVDARKHLITLAKTKNHERRIIPLNYQALEVLRTLPKHVESFHVFCDQQGRPYQRIVKGFRAGLQAGGYQRFSLSRPAPYLRQSSGDAGGATADGAELLGHKTGQMTLRYTTSLHRTCKKRLAF